MDTSAETGDVSLGDLLVAVAGCNPDEPLVYGADTTWTGQETVDRADALARLLTESGTAEGSAVAVSLPNGPAVVAALFGVWRAGCTYVPVNPRLTDAEIDHVVRSVRPAVWIASPDAAGRVTVPRTIVPTNDGWHRQESPEEVDAVLRDRSIALIQFTSGTTGRPKPVMLRHAGVLELLDGVVQKLRGQRVESGEERRPRRDPMPNLIPVSLSLWAGIYNVLFAFRVGAPVVIMDAFEPARFVELARRFGIRSSVLPPAAMAMLTADPGIDDLGPIRMVRAITAPLSPSQARRFGDRFGVAVLNSYGQTEIGGEIIGWNAEDVRRHGSDKLGSVGRPHEGVSVRVTGPEGDDLPPGTHGEIRVRTPSLSAGYADGTDLSDRLDPAGWFRTGDVGCVDPDGFVWIDGRVSQMINRGGLKIYPAEVEEVLRSCPGVDDAAVVAVPDERLGEVPWAFVVCPAGAQEDPADLEAVCRQNLAPYKVPVEFTPLERLPRNEIGKVLVAELEALASDRRRERHS